MSIIDKDQLSRFTLEDTNVRGEWLHLDQSWQDIQSRSDYPEVIKTVLGEALAAVTLLSSIIKYEGSLILQIKATGPVHLLVVQATSDNTVRGLARWQGDLPDSTSLQALFGDGNMVITMQPNNGSKPYQGIVAMQGDSMQACFQEYFQQSEQLETQLWLAANEKSCAGFLLQRLPGERHDEDGWERATQLAATLSIDELLSTDRDVLIHQLYHQETVKLYSATAIQFRCGCSIERIESVVQSLGEKEANSIIREQGKIEVDCEFCNEHYELTDNDVTRLFAPHPPSDTQH